MIYLEPKQVPSALRQGYAGGHFRAEVCESVTVPMDAGLWSGGSRDLFTAVRLVDGQSMPLSDQDAAPWDMARTERKVALRPGFAVVKHTMFCGKDMGLTFYLHPVDAAPMLPAPVELTYVERLVLNATRSFKSSYGGRDRYQMAQSEARYRESDQPFPTRAQWDDAKLALFGRGYLNKAGAITVAGRNAANSIGR